MATNLSLKEQSLSLVESTGALRVLLVEDSPFQQKLMSLLLKQLGHEVTVAGSGIQGLSKLVHSRFDVVLMDCHMPGMTGMEATRLIRRMERITGRHLPIIGISTNASAEECFDADMDDFLMKPVCKPILKATLGRWVRLTKNSSGRRS